MSALYLFARIAGTAVAIPTEEVEAVVRLRGLSPVPGAPAYVAGLSALRSRVLTIIDAAVLICGPGAHRPFLPEERGHAIVCDISGHSYGILVDSVEDIQTINNAPMPVGGRVSEAWRPYASSIVDHQGNSYFILSVNNLLDACVAGQLAQ